MASWSTRALSIWTKTNGPFFDDVFHVMLGSGSIELIFKKRSRRLDTMFIYPQGEAHASAYKLLLWQTEFAHSRAIVRGKLGEPTAQSQPGSQTALGAVAPRDSFQRDGIRVNFQYAWDQESIDLMTVMAPRA